MKCISEELEEAEVLGDPDSQSELELFRKLAKTGDLNLREALIVRFLHLVPPIVRKFRQQAEWDDLMQVGYLGLIKAVDNFDAERGLRFSTYATHCVAGELRHYIRDRVSTIRRPRWLIGLSRRVAMYIERHLLEKHRLPTIAEISRELNISEEGVMEILKFKAPISLDAGTQEDGIAIEKIRSLRYEDFRLPLEDQIFLMGAMERLLEVERRVVYLFYYKDLNQSQIASMVGLAPRKVSRLMTRALEKLRGIVGKDFLTKQQESTRERGINK